MDKLLRELYYDPDSAACYAGVRTLFREAKKRAPSVRIKDVEDFLYRQRTYTLHKTRRKRFPRKKVVASGVDTNWQADLADLKALSRQNKNYKYLLTVVDVFSKYGWAVPIKNKKPETAAKAFLWILEKSGRKPWWLYTDRGNEFVGRPFRKMLDEQGITHVLATSPDIKAPNVERYNRTIKTRLWKYFTQWKTLKYLDVLQSIVDDCNNSYSRPIGCAPAEVTRKNENRIRKRLYPLQLDDDDARKPKRRFRAGDRVRTVEYKKTFDKGYTRNFSEEVFVVDKVLSKQNPVVYKLKDLDSTPINGAFYKEELCKTD